MKTDIELQHNVLEELKGAPSVDAADIGVTVDDGVVTLSGRVRFFPEKWEAVRAAQRVAGVRAVIAEMGSPTMKDVGTVMKSVMAKFAAAGQRVDGKTVNEMVRGELAGK